jgi:hypothetical protein
MNAQRLTIAAERHQRLSRGYRLAGDASLAFAHANAAARLHDAASAMCDCNRLEDSALHRITEFSG